MTLTKENIYTFNVAKYDSILARGLSKGLGKQNNQVCIEAAICETLGLPHGDEPNCVSRSVRHLKIALNDKNWSTPQARAKGLHDLGLAQLGSLGIVDDNIFSKRITEEIIGQLIPKFFRSITKNKNLLSLVDICERNKNYKSIRNLATAAAYEADTYLIMLSKIALDILIELKSPGCLLLGIKV